MAICRICGLATRPEEHLVMVRDDEVHRACVDEPVGPKRRRIGAWAAFGSGGQMAMGAVQQD
ncbi:MAG: hypothetical protein ACOYMR_10715 [Ilumatobacteraceae bacterium]